MKRKFLLMVLALVLCFTTCLAMVGCEKDKDKDGDSSSSISQTSSSTSGGNQSTGGGSSSSGGNNPVKTPLDRSDKNLATLADACLEVPVSSVIQNGGVAISSNLSSFMVGDIYNSALVVVGADLAVGGAQIGPDFLPKYFGYTYYSDGNWYDVSGKAVHKVLNELLNYKLDGSKELNVNLALYGDYTVAQVLFGFTTEKVDNITDMKNGIISTLMAESPVASAVLNMNMAQVSALLGEDPSAAMMTAISVFGNLKVADIMGVDQNLLVNKFEKACYDLTFVDGLSFLLATDSQSVAGLIAENFVGVTLGDVISFYDETAPQIDAISALSVSALANAYATDTLTAYLSDQLSTVYMVDVLNALGVDEVKVAEILTAYPPLSEMTLGQIIVSGLETAEMVSAQIDRIVIAITDFQNGDSTALNNLLQEVYATIGGLLPSVDDPSASVVSKLLSKAIGDLIVNGTTIENIQTEIMNAVAMVMGHVTDETGAYVGLKNIDLLIADLKAVYGDVVNEYLAVIDPSMNLEVLEAQINALVQQYMPLINIIQEAMNGLTPSLTPVAVMTEAMAPSVNAGDLVLIDYLTSEYAVGDIVAVVDFATNSTSVSRIVEINDSLVTLKGDANEVADQPIEISALSGKVVHLIPGIGQYYLMLQNLAAMAPEELIQTIASQIYAQYQPVIDAFILERTGFTTEELIAAVEGAIANYQSVYAEGGIEALIKALAYDLGLGDIDAILLEKVGVDLKGLIAAINGIYAEYSAIYAEQGIVGVKNAIIAEISATIEQAKNDGTIAAIEAQIVAYLEAYGFNGAIVEEIKTAVSTVIANNQALIEAGDYQAVATLVLAEIEKIAMNAVNEFITANADVIVIDLGDCEITVQEALVIVATLSNGTEEDVKDLLGVVLEGASLNDILEYLLSMIPEETPPMEYPEIVPAA